MEGAFLFMRARNLKPSIFKNEFLARLAPDSYRAFTGLWCLADREGRLEDRPDRIEAEIFPFKFQKINIEKILNDLSFGNEPFIIRYKSGAGKPLIQIVNFKKHQYPHIKESASTIPAPCSTSANTIPAHLNPESPILNPESPIPSTGVDVLFASFWKAYPKKKGKGAAEKVWGKIPSVKAIFENIVGAVIAQARSEDWLKDGGQYIPHPAKWLKERRWEDEIKIKKEVPAWNEIQLKKTPSPTQ